LQRKFKFTFCYNAIYWHYGELLHWREHEFVSSINLTVVKAAVSQDFRPLAFFIKQSHLRPPEIYLKQEIMYTVAEPELQGAASFGGSLAWCSASDSGVGHG
jgi:hypothetical protein